jgi:hypothetical protein
MRNGVAGSAAGVSGGEKPPADGGSGQQDRQRVPLPAREGARDCPPPHICGDTIR